MFGFYDVEGIDNGDDTQQFISQTSKNAVYLIKTWPKELSFLAHLWPMIFKWIWPSDVDRDIEMKRAHSLDPNWFESMTTFIDNLLSILTLISIDWKHSFE